MVDTPWDPYRNRFGSVTPFPSNRLSHKLVGSAPKGNGPLYAKYVEVLDALGERQKAEEAFTAGWRRYPGDRELAAVASQRSFITR
jgi:hypothetical protein